MKKYLLLLILATQTLLLFPQGGWRKNEKEIKVIINSYDEAIKLNQLKLNGDYFPGYALLYVTPDEINKLDHQGITYEIIIENLDQHYSGFWSQRDAYHTYQEIINLMDSLTTAFPDICMKVNFGTSMEGRELAALKISDNVTIDQPEAEVMFDGGIHGDEIGGAENLIRFARHLCLEYENDPDITALINNREIWLYIMVNPDGRVNMSRYNFNGVDLNREWGYMWDGWGNSPAPFSQVESKALRECVFGNQFVIHTSYHSGTEYVSYPWSYRLSAAPDEEHIDYLAGLYSTISGYPFLAYGQGSGGMYPINGSTKDSNYGIMGSVCWSMEISFNKQPSADDIMLYYNYNEPSMIAMIEYAGYGIQGIVTDSITGEPVTALIRIDDSFPVYTDQEGGDYHKYLIPGTYSVTAFANGYQTKIIDNIVISEYNDVVVQNIQLSPESGRYIYKICNVNVPNNNPEDEGNTPAIFDKPDSVYYSLGKLGSIVIDMLEPIPLGPIHEFTVYEGDITHEDFFCYISTSMDGPWTGLGEFTGTAEIDIPESAGDSIRYIRIKDDGTGPSNVNDAGYDLDAIAVTDQSNIIQLIALDCIIVDTASGNGDGQIDPGETVDVLISLTNQGDFTAENTYGKIKSDPFYIYLNQDSVFYGDILPGDTVIGTFNITADPATPVGHFITIRLEVDASEGFYTNTYLFPFNIGQITVGIIDLDENANSGTAMEECCQNLDISYQYMTELPQNFVAHRNLFVCLGTGNDKHILTEEEGDWLNTFLINTSGNLYMEGGDTWFSDPQTSVHQMFDIEGIEEGSGDLESIIGLTGSFVQDMNFIFSGDNNSVDHIAAMGSGSAFPIFQNNSPVYTCGVANHHYDYKTIGTSFEFGGIDDGNPPSTKQALFQRYLDFFDGVFTAYTENPQITSSVEFYDNYPNPFDWETTISYSLTEDMQILVEIYNIEGKKINTLVNSIQKQGTHHVIWNGTDQHGYRLPDGLYFCMLKANGEVLTNRLIINPK